MPHEHAPSLTTHTVEMAQIAELNAQLAARGFVETISAGDIGLVDARARSGGDADCGGLPAEAILEHLSWDGSPEFPYIYAHFRLVPAGTGRLTVDLHTDALRHLSHLLHVREVWGVGSV